MAAAAYDMKGSLSRGHDGAKALADARIALCRKVLGRRRGRMNE